MTIGDRLKQARLKAKLTQVALSNLSGVSQARISAIEKGVQETSSYIIELAEGLGVTPQWLKTGENRGDEDQEFTPSEIKLIELFRQLDSDERAREIAYMQKLVVTKDILNKM